MPFLAAAAPPWSRYISMPLPIASQLLAVMLMNALKLGSSKVSHDDTI